MKKLLSMLLTAALIMAFAVSCEEDTTELDDDTTQDDVVDGDTDTDTDTEEEESLDTDFPDEEPEADEAEPLYPDLEQVVYEDEKVSVDGLTDSYVELNGLSSLTITGDASSIVNSIINIKDLDSRLFLPAVSLDDWSTFNVADCVKINGQTFNENVNAKVKPYYDYVFIEPQGVGFSPATIYSGEESSPIERSTIYLGSAIPLGDNAVDKIFLKQGHQIVVAASEDGLDSSRCFVAVSNDLMIELDETLAGRVSFMRCLAVDYVNKRGLAGTGYLSYNMHLFTNSPWYYNWTPNTATTTKDLDITFQPMYNSSKWVEGEYCAHETIINSEYPLLMAFNEPDNKDQSNLEVDEAIRLYKEMHKLGVRLGSPSTEQVGTGSSNAWSSDSKWIKQFMTACEEEGLRVDVMGIHWYDVGNSGNVTVSNASASATRFMTNAKYCYEEFGLPIIATEWNCAGSGSTANQDWDVHAAFFNSALPQMEACEYIERYALFAPGGIGNAYTTTNGVTTLTNGGQAYFETTPTTPSIVLGDDSRVVE